MRMELTKTFSFSACHTASGRILGRNYLLKIALEWLPEAREKILSDIVRREILSKVHTRDLGEDVFFLKRTEIDDASILKAFWQRLSGPLEDFQVKYLTLQRDSETSTTFWPEPPE